MSGLTNVQSGANIVGSLPIQYKDAAGNDVDVTAATPLPTTSSGGGSSSSLVQFDKAGVTQTVSDTGAGNKLPVEGDFYPATQPVSGTFWQATQPISGTVALSGTSPVSGTVVLGTGSATIGKLGANSGTTIGKVGLVAGTAAIGKLGPGSATIGDVTVSSMPSVAVTGTFWQATQPVSGTFWQATQPVSGTVNISGYQKNSAFVDSHTTTIVDQATNVNRGPVSERGIGVESVRIEDTILAEGTSYVLLSNAAGSGVWYKVTYATIDRTSIPVGQQFPCAFGVQRAIQHGSAGDMYGPEVRVIGTGAAGLRAGSSPLMESRGALWVLPGEKLVVNGGNGTGGQSYTAMVDYEIYA